MDPITLVWLRRDLRLEDHCALHHALKHRPYVLPLFIFDRDLLEALEDPTDARVTFIYQTLQQLKQQLEARGSSLLVEYGSPLEVFSRLLQVYSVKAVYYNRDYEPRAIERDRKVEQWLGARDVEVQAFKDQVIFEGNDILKKDGRPYTVYTPYSKKWKQQLAAIPVSVWPVEDYAGSYHRITPLPMPTLASMGFQSSTRPFPPCNLDDEVIATYDRHRDYPAADGTTRLGMHLRFGTLSIRRAVLKGRQLNETWLNELIWREFFMMILWHFPGVVDRAFKPAYDQIQWRDDPGAFEAWCRGQTGYPLVDAGMRQLNETGYMHNRLRMVTASFLTKHLLLDWRWGEAYFAGKLLDYELASNNGGWQWAAGSGCDAAPYFRIFNPTRQMERFDSEGAFVRHWVPEYFTGGYPHPIVEHKFARERALQTYRHALKS